MASADTMIESSASGTVCGASGDTCACAQQKRRSHTPSSSDENTQTDNELVLQRLVDYHNNNEEHAHKAGNLLNLTCAGEQCAVCLKEKFTREEQRGMARTCGHVFCFQCIRKWTKISPVCPLCKESMKEIIFEVHDDLCLKVFNTVTREIYRKETLHPRRKLVYLFGLRPRCETKRLPPGVLDHPKAWKLRKWVVRDIEAVYQVQGNSLDVIIDAVTTALHKEGSRTSAVEEALGRALPVPADQFIRELESFLWSNLSIEEYDRSVKYVSDKSARNTHAANVLLLVSSLENLNASVEELLGEDKEEEPKQRKGKRKAPWERMIEHYTSNRSPPKKQKNSQAKSVVEQKGVQVESEEAKLQSFRRLFNRLTKSH